MNKTVQLILRIIIAVILVQTLRYKFTAHPDSVYIFTKVGLEPYGRIVIGVFELIAAILILIPKTVWLGALLTLGIISGGTIYTFNRFRYRNKWRRRYGILYGCGSFYLITSDFVDE
ncbi:MAG: DoxX family protein [Flavobacteriaceae bacterium]|nr:DoxX family protein [Flavobacteriaceae bacterium]